MSAHDLRHTTNGNTL